jgi:hypothetical protein
VDDVLGEVVVAGRDPALGAGDLVDVALDMRGARATGADVRSPVCQPRNRSEETANRGCGRSAQSPVNTPLSIWKGRHRRSVLARFRSSVKRPAANGIPRSTGRCALRNLFATAHPPRHGYGGRPTTDRP